tara:strand:+ start:812 stop:1168 length:357 start_codon:yes stop_codon:yes gene_type:complete
MSIEITIYASDIQGLDDLIERTMDIKHYYGTALFDEHGRLIPLHAYEYAIEPTCYLGLMMSQQEQITDLEEIVVKLGKEVHQLKKIVGWSSGYDDNGWNVGDSLSKRVKALEKEVEKL